MEETSLFASFIVVFGGLLFQSGAQAVRAGTVQPWVMRWVDVCVATLLAGSTGVMVLALVLSTVLMRGGRKRRTDIAAEPSLWKAPARGQSGRDMLDSEVQRPSRLAGGPGCTQERHGPNGDEASPRHYPPAPGTEDDRRFISTVWVPNSGNRKFAGSPPRQQQFRENPLLRRAAAPRK